MSKLIINRFSHYRTWGIVFSRAEHALGASERPARLLRPLYCSLAGRDSSLYYLRPNPLRLWNGLQPWTARRAIGTEPPALPGTREAHLELPLRGPCIVRWQEILSPSYYLSLRPLGTGFSPWNARRANGTGFSLWTAPWRSWTARRLLERAKRIWNHLELSLRLYLERPPAFWTARRALRGCTCTCVRW